MSLAWRVLRQHRGQLAAGLLLMLIGRAAALLLPASTKYVYDDVIGRGRADLLVPIAAAVFGVTLIIAVTSYLLTIVLAVTAQHTIAELRADLQRHVLALPMRYHDATHTGELVPRVMLDPEGVTNLVGTGIIQLAGGLLTATLGCAVLLYLNWRLTIGTLLLLALFAAVTLFTLQRLRPLLRERAAYFARLSGRLTEQLAALRTVRAFGTAPREQRQFHEGVRVLRDMTTRSLLTASLLTSGTTVIVGAIGAVIMIAGGSAVLANDMTPGELIWFAMTVAFVARPLGSIAAAATQLMQSLAGFDRIHELHAVPADDEDAPARQPVAALAGDVVFEDVAFRYDNGRGIADVSFHVPAGTFTAITGPSGAGKSTLLFLLAALQRPDAGRVLIDGRDLRSLRMSDYRRHIGVVLQDALLFDASIRDNIAYAHPAATDADVVEAAAIAGVTDFIDDLEDGYATVVGERGVRLSAGQRQRIALARAILGQPAILLLDEATAHLDAATEARVLHALRRARAGRTTFFVAHSEAAAAGADQTLVLGDGSHTTAGATGSGAMAGRL